MEDQDLSLIERFFQNALTEQELEVFRRRLEADPVFREEVELHRMALSAIQLEATERLRKRLQKKGRLLDSQDEQKRRRVFWYFAPVAILLMALLVWWSIQQPQQQHSSPPTQEEKVIPVPTDTMPPARPPAEPAAPSASGRTAGNARVFAAYFKPYRDASLEPVVRGASDTLSLSSDRFQQLYWEGRYAEALEVFEALGSFAKSNDNLRFQQANCLLATGKADQAAGVLESVIRNDRSRFTAQASWYLALAQLRAGNRAEAIKMLESIAANPDAPRQSDARAAIQALK